MTQKHNSKPVPEKGEDQFDEEGFDKIKLERENQKFRKRMIPIIADIKRRRLLTINNLKNN